MIDISRQMRGFSQQSHQTGGVSVAFPGDQSQRRQEIADAIVAVPQKQLLLVARAAAGEEASSNGDMMGNRMGIEWEHGISPATMGIY